MTSLQDPHYQLHARTTDYISTYDGGIRGALPDGTRLSVGPRRKQHCFLVELTNQRPIGSYTPARGELLQRVVLPTSRRLPPVATVDGPMAAPVDETF